MSLFEYGKAKKKRFLTNCRFSILLKVEKRIKTKNGIEDIIKQKHGEADKSKGVSTTCNMKTNI